MGRPRHPRHVRGEHVTATVLAEGPGTVDAAGHLLTTRLRIPAERTDPGPIGARMEIVLGGGGGDDDDEDAGDTGTRAVDLSVAAGWGMADFPAPDVAALVASTGFLAQHVYAIAMDTLAEFERTLGRRMGWADDRRLRIFADEDIGPEETGYQRSDCAIRFGRAPGTHVSLAFHRDLLVHEVTHAILDGYRRRWSDRWAILDQFALHEAIADLVALLSLFSSEEVVERLLDAELDRDARGGPVAPDAWDDAILRSGLFGFADHLLTHSGALRTPISAVPPAGWRESTEPHLRSAGVVHAVMETVLRLWSRRLDQPGMDSSVFLVASAGAEVGTHLRRMLVRGLAYMPPVDVGPEDLLRGILDADETVVPDDSRGYRTVLVECFAEVGVAVTGDKAGTSHVGPLGYEFRNGMRDAGPEEIIQFVWNNPAMMRALAIDSSRSIIIERLRASTRISPDGFLVTETSASIVQEYVASAAEARGLGLRCTGPVVIRGGALLRFDDGGNLSFMAAKPVLDIARQQRKLEELERERGAAAADPDSSEYRDRLVAMHTSRWTTPATST